MLAVRFSQNQGLSQGLVAAISVSISCAVQRGIETPGGIVEQKQYGIWWAD